MADRAEETIGTDPAADLEAQYLDSDRATVREIPGE
jgi:hypothetical protein